MSRHRPPLVALLGLSSLVLLVACGPMDPPVDAPEHPASAAAPIVGGILDPGRSYVVGVADNQGAFCTGTVISRRTVLTAGHCYTSNAGPKGGILKILFGPDLGAASVVSVDTIKAVRHPGYDDKTLSNDLCLVELASDAPSQAAPLLRETLTNGPAFIGPNFTFVGYGDDGLGNFGLRRVVTLPIEVIGPANVGIATGSGPIDDTMFFFEVPKKNTCNGDSGGPAFVVRSGVERVAGSTSSGDDKCVIDGTDARTDAPAIAAFIQPTIDLFEGNDPCRSDGVCDESCNVGGNLGDPDCAAAHCGADGICALSCVAPVDPDCAVVDDCGADGVCDPSCAADPDCSTTASTGAGGGASTSAGVGGSGGADSTTGAGGSGSSTTSGTGGGSEEKGGCGCRIAGEEDGDSAVPGRLGWLFAAAAAMLRRRPRR
jgi:hypothetical protein